MLTALGLQEEASCGCSPGEELCSDHQETREAVHLEHSHVLSRVVLKAPMRQHSEGSSRDLTPLVQAEQGTMHPAPQHWGWPLL